MKISIVTGTYNRISYLERMIDSVRVQIPNGIEREFIVVDGGSTDDTLRWCKAAHDIVLIEHGKLLGVQRAFCDGANAATGEYVILANDDIRFMPDSIMPALVYLENNMGCGGIAFEDNRSNRGEHANEYGVQGMPAQGDERWVIYAQVGMYPRDVGERAGWWGIDDPDLPTISYGVDNYLSARIWEMGLSIDRVPGCKIHDEIVRDGLREKMQADNTDGYFVRYPRGPNVPKKRESRPKHRHLRCLYLPIYERGHTVQLTQKTGLREALKDHGRGLWVWEFNYMYSKNAYHELCDILDTFKPDMVITQFHDADTIKPEHIRMARAHAPKSVWINWNGDYWPQALKSEQMMYMLRQIDLQLVVNGSVLEFYEQNAIQAAYWQIGYEDPPEKANFVAEHCDVIWLATIYNDSRKEVHERLQEFNYRLYTPGDEPSTLYNFTNAKALYRAAKIAIGTNEYPDAYGFVSNRLFQSLAAGKCLLMHQHIPGLYELTGIKEGQHYVGYDSLDELVSKLKYYLEHDAERLRIANRGTRYVRQHHSFGARVSELFRDLIHLTKKPPATYFGVRYHGPLQTTHGALVNGKQYTIQPGRVSNIEPEHAYWFERQPQLYQVIYPQEP